ncbi:MAG TPA: hypothetical protein VL306_02690, partial [Methylomirabilota bacterium]|nr:hypothetical protein [Methylomirabilota bacterium]
KQDSVSVTFKQGSLLKPWKNKHFDIIVANLPYLAQQTDPSTKFEPKPALIAKNKGLALYQELFQKLSYLPSPPSSIFLELGHDQAKPIKKLAANFLPAYEIKISKDLAGRTRYAYLAKR